MGERNCGWRTLTSTVNPSTPLRSEATRPRRVESLSIVPDFNRGLTGGLGEANPPVLLLMPKRDT